MELYPFSIQPIKGNNCGLIPYWSPINILKQSFSETIRPIELKFHMKTPYDKFALIYTNCYGHMTKMADIPIYGKKNL